MYTMHVYFFDFRLFCIDNTRIIYRKMRYTVYPHEMCTVKDDQALVAQSLRKVPRGASLGVLVLTEVETVCEMLL
jgi:hypothetical protein